MTEGEGTAAQLRDSASTYQRRQRWPKVASIRAASREGRTCLNVYIIIPALGNAWMGDLDLPDLNATIRSLTLQDGNPASGSTKSTVASVLRRLFAWAREERIIPANPALELRTGWGGSVRRRVHGDHDPGEPADAGHSSVSCPAMMPLSGREPPSSRPG